MPVEAANVRGFDAFLEHLLAAESGIDPSRFGWYLENLAVPAIDYPRVTFPGRALRDPQTGRCVVQRMTVGEYFTALGVGHLFAPADAGCMRRMQYASTNALGFVGYQVGEQALIEAGYYRPQIVRRRGRLGLARRYASHYVGSVPDERWRNGRMECLYRLPGNRRAVVATDVNRWAGTFTGKNGVSSLDDLKTPDCQERVIRELLDRNHARMQTMFAEWRFDVSASGFTWSALLAAAHLRGPGAAVAFITQGAVSYDEFGTTIADYITRFAGYTTPYDLRAV